jgi:endogenous inhibitor of DNA gyrase (YacG/DUF329 family)
MKTLSCPTCRRPVSKDMPGLEKLFPFCSERCHLVDLGRWLGEEYRIAGEPAGSVGAPGAGDDDADSDAR